MRNFTIFFIIFSLTFLPLKKANGCEDIINSFLSQKSVNSKFRNSITKFTNSLTILEKKISAENLDEYIKSINNTITIWFSFYSTYAKKPPKLWKNSKVWIDKLGEITRKLSTLKKLDLKKDNRIMFNLAENINKDVVELLFNSSLKLSEIEFLSKIEGILEDIKNIKFTNGEIEVKLTDITTYLKFFSETTQKSISKKLITEYMNQKNLLIKNIRSIDIKDKNFINDISNSIEKIRKFKSYRKVILKKSWF